VREQDGLRVLHVGAPRHRGGAGRLGLRRNGVDQVDHPIANYRGVVEQVEPDEGSDLVVATASGTKLATELGPGNLQQPTLQREVHIFVGIEGNEVARLDLGLQLGECREHPLDLISGEIACRGQGLGVCLRPRDVVRIQLPVEVRRATERRELWRWTRRKSGAPE
jgi:hypothetical protein